MITSESVVAIVSADQNPLVATLAEGGHQTRHGCRWRADDRQFGRLRQAVHVGIDGLAVELRVLRVDRVQIALEAAVHDVPAHDPLGVRVEDGAGGEHLRAGRQRACNGHTLLLIDVSVLALSPAMIAALRPARGFSWVAMGAPVDSRIGLGSRGM